MTQSVHASPHRPHLVIIGAGFGGQAIARQLKSAPINITLIDKNNYQTFQPLLYQVATAELEPEEIVYPIRGLFRKQKNLRFLLGKVVDMDLVQKRLILASGERLSFDYLAVAAGSRPQFYGIPGAEQFSFPLKELQHSVWLRSHILKQFERAEQQPALIKKGLLNFVVIGGGPTGVETAGALIELFRHVLPRDYPSLPLEKARVVLVEAGPELLRPFREESRAHALEMLKEQGVNVLLDERVERLTQRAVILGGKRLIPTQTAIWAVGVQANKLAEQLGVAQTGGGRIEVLGDLSLPHHREVFVVGDMAGAKNEDGRLFPQLATVARQQGRHVGRQIERRIANEQTHSFSFRDPGSMAIVSKHAAVAELPGDIRLAGFVAWLAWMVLHVALLAGWHNKLHVLISWCCNYISNDRSARLILDPHVKPNVSRVSARPAVQPAPKPQAEVPPLASRFLSSSAIQQLLNAESIQEARSHLQS